MTENSISKPVQYALIAWIAKELSGSPHRLGKKALQKVVHLIQELGGVDFGYRFSFYTYGPYSSGLAGDLDVVAALEGVRVTYDASENHYHITMGQEGDRMVEKGKVFIDQNRVAINQVMATFGGRLAKNLELVSTIAFLRRHAPPIEFDSDEKLAARVKELKPKFKDFEINDAINEVRGFLSRREMH